MSKEAPLSLFLIILLFILGKFIKKKLNPDSKFYNVMQKILSVILLIGLWPLTSYSKDYLILIIIVIYITYNLPNWQAKIIKNNYVHKLRYEFPIWLRQLQVLLQNNNVLYALKATIASAPPILKDELALMVSKIENNSVDEAAFVDFLKEYEIYEIQKAMKLLYRYHIDGNDESYRQFQRMLESTSKWLRTERSKTKETTIALLSWIGMIPLFGVTGLFMVMMIQIINMMMKGGY